MPSILEPWLGTILRLQSRPIPIAMHKSWSTGLLLAVFEPVTYRGNLSNACQTSCSVLLSRFRRRKTFITIEILHQKRSRSGGIPIATGLEDTRTADITPGELFGVTRLSTGAMQQAWLYVYPQQ